MEFHVILVVFYGVGADTADAFVMIVIEMNCVADVGDDNNNADSIFDIVTGDDVFHTW